MEIMDFFNSFCLFQIEIQLFSINNVWSSFHKYVYAIFHDWHCCENHDYGKEISANRINEVPFRYKVNDNRSNHNSNGHNHIPNNVQKRTLHIYIIRHHPISLRRRPMRVSVRMASMPMTMASMPVTMASMPVVVLVVVAFFYGVDFEPAVVGVQNFDLHEVEAEAEDRGDEHPGADDLRWDEEALRGFVEQPDGQHPDYYDRGERSDDLCAVVTER